VSGNAKVVWEIWEILGKNPIRIKMIGKRDDKKITL